MNHESIHHSITQHSGSIPFEVAAIGFGITIFLYGIAAICSNKKYQAWPISRFVYWLLGTLSVLLAVTGPLAQLAHADFTAHMLIHLLLGMLGPLLFVLSAPMTLLLRAVSISSARQLTLVLNQKLLHLLIHPIVAALLNVGGLWVLYKTELYEAMHQKAAIHWLVHGHLLAAGFVFTLSMIRIDPMPRQTSFVYRAVVLAAALTAHNVLAKQLYTTPPEGVPEVQAQWGAQLMYYGGDAVNAVLITLFCLQWYKAARHRRGQKAVHTGIRRA